MNVACFKIIYINVQACLCGKMSWLTKDLRTKSTEKSYIRKKNPINNNSLPITFHVILLMVVVLKTGYVIMDGHVLRKVYLHTLYIFRSGSKVGMIPQSKALHLKSTQCRLEHLTFHSYIWNFYGVHLCIVLTHTSSHGPSPSCELCCKVDISNIHDLVSGYCPR